MANYSSFFVPFPTSSLLVLVVDRATFHRGSWSRPASSVTRGVMQFTGGAEIVGLHQTFATTNQG